MTMNTEKNLLEELLHEIKLENTSVDFMKNVMVRVEKEVIKQQRKKHFYSCLWIAAGVISFICIPALVLFLLGIDISFKMNIPDMFRGIHIEPSYIMYAVIILFLLIGDTLLRKYSRVFGKN